MIWHYQGEPKVITMVLIKGTQNKAVRGEGKVTMMETQLKVMKSENGRGGHKLMKTGTH